MKLIAASLVILAAFTLGIQASGPTFDMLYNVSFPNTGVEYYSNGLYYFSYTIYNISSGQIYPIVLPKFCTVYPQFSPQVIPWCYGSVTNNDGTITFNVYYLNSYLNQSIASQIVGTFPTQTFISFEYTNGFLVLIVTGYQSSEYNYTLAIYDVENMQQVCSKATIDQVNGANTIYTDGNIFLSGYLDNSHNAHFNLLNCSSGQIYPSPGINEYFEIDLYGFNNSAVFINYYEYQKNLQTSYMIQPAAFDSFNRLRFGSSINVTEFLPYNGTHFFMAYAPNGKYTFGLFVITAELQILEVLSFTLGIAAGDFTAYPVYGTSWITLNLGGTFVTYDVGIRSIISVNSIIPPIILNNGSVVNMTTFGYFIQNPQGPFNFISSPFSNPINGIYQDPTDFNQYYTLFVPSTSDPTYNKCLLTHVNATSSQISQTFFPNCPLTLPTTSNAINIKDVQYDANGNPHVVYRDPYGSVIVINPAGSNGPFKSTYLYTTIQFGLNLTNGTINFVGSQLTSFVLGRISLSNGAVLASQTFPSGTYYTSIIKITAQYYSLIYTETKTKFELVDAVNLVKVSSVTSDTLFSYYQVPGFVLGFNASAPSNFSGYIFWTTGYIYLMNNLGGTSVLNPGQSITVYDVVPINQNQFFASQYESYLDGEVLYQINSWGYNATQARQEPEDIEV